VTRLTREQGCGEQAGHTLRESFEQLFAQLQHCLQHDTNNYWRLLLLDFFVLQYRAEDAPLLHASNFFAHLLRACDQSVTVKPAADDTQALQIQAAQLPSSFSAKYSGVLQQLVGATTDFESHLKGQSVAHELEPYSPEYSLVMWLYPHSYAEVQSTAGNRCLVHKTTDSAENVISLQVNGNFSLTFTVATATGVK
jgi:hypothetical protein